MRGFKCIVPRCKSNNKDNPELCFFCLPKFLTVCEQWANNMHLTEFLTDKSNSQRNHFRVCSLHFGDACFQTPCKKKLNRGAVPTILHINNEVEFRTSAVNESLSGHSSNLPLVVAESLSGASTNLSLSHNA